MHSSDPSEAKTQYHHGNLRAQLVSAVRELVESHGPEGFSISQASRMAGVSSAAPYKHFKDKPEILRAVVSDAMDRLRDSMEKGAAGYPVGSLEAVSAIGLAYIQFAKTEPGVFRLMFGLTDGHEKTPELQQKGTDCFDVVGRATGAYLGVPEDTPEVQQLAYLLWCFVHGHSFLIIDEKTEEVADKVDDWALLMRIGRGILGEKPNLASGDEAP